MLKILFPLLVVILLIVLIKRAKRTHGDSCVNLENYKLIKESQFTNQYSEHNIVREEKELIFKAKGYTLFSLTIDSTIDQEEVKLKGKDGYGKGNEEYERYICQLVKKIKRKEENNH